MMSNQCNQIFPHSLGPTLYISQSQRAPRESGSAWIYHQPHPVISINVHLSSHLLPQRYLSTPLNSTPLHSTPAPLHLPQPPSPSSHPIQLPNQLLRNTLQLLSSPPLRTHYRPFSSGCSVEETYMSRGE